MTDQKLTAKFPTGAQARHRARFLVLAVLLPAPLPAAARAILIDGDTLDIDGTRIWIVAIDTPETFRPRCQPELVLGLAAKARLQALLDGGEVTFKATGIDRYGRTLAHVCAGDVDVGAKLIDEGHALRYSLGPKAKRLAVRCGP